MERSRNAPARWPPEIVPREEPALCREFHLAAQEEALLDAVVVGLAQILVAGVGADVIDARDEPGSSHIKRM